MEPDGNPDHEKLSTDMFLHRPDPPEPSCVSMKSDWSMDHPLKLSGHTEKSRPEPSCVSMKSDWSMDHPLKLRGHTDLGFRPDPPEPSCVSMKSDWSMDHPLKLSGHTEKSRPDPPEPSCVSMKSDWSMDHPLKLSGHTEKSRPDPPEPSCVSMKSDWSMDHPLKLSGHTEKSSSVQKHRPESSELSCVSMKSDCSLDPPLNFRGHTGPRFRMTVQQHRPESSELSCVSMKSDCSLDPPLNFRGHTGPRFSSVQKHRPESSELSCVSMKSDCSLDPPLNFRGHTGPRFSSVQKHRPESSEPSCVSMKSDCSLDPPLNFRGHTGPRFSSVQKHRPESSEPSCVSMKSDRSMDPPHNFRGHTGPRFSSVQKHRPESSEPSCVSMKSDRSMDPPHNFRGHTGPRFSSVQKHRPESSEPSCVSMKSDRSMDPPHNFRGRTGPRFSSVQKHRPESSEPSCVSMKSDRSIDPPHNFRGHTGRRFSSVQKHRPESSEPSCVSMKSDCSMDPPFHFRGHPDFGFSSVQKHRPESSEPSCVSMKSDRSMEHPLNFRGHTGHRFRHGPQREPLKLFRSNLGRKFECLCEGTVTQGNPTLLNEIYTELYITESESGEINNEHEVRQIETQSRRAATEDTAIKCRDIFRPLPGQDKPIRTVLTKGVAGIGKTVSVQKFILDWAEGQENQDVQLIFPLPFREINLMKDKTLSLLDLLHIFFPETKEMKPFSGEYKVLFIFDGLDECRLPLNFDCSETLQDVTKETSVDELLMNLIEGNLLPSALIWITSRPAAADLVPSECVHRVTEIRGFSDPQKEEYFWKRISDQGLAERIISHLKSSRSLFIMCHIPVFCWISAAVLEKMMKKSWRGEIPKTLTQMYTHFLIIQTNIKHEKDYEKNVKDEDMILKLGKLSFQQLVKGNLIFYEEDLRECGIDATEASVYSGLCTQIFREELGLYQGKVFCFVHLSIQEHLAALYVLLSFLLDKRDVLNENLSSKYSHEFTRHTISDLHQRAVDKALQRKNGHLDLFLRFLLGLSLESNQTLLKGLLTRIVNIPFSEEETIEYIKTRIKLNRSPEKSINLFHCLNELGDQSLVSEVQKYLSYGGLSGAKLSSTQWSAVIFVLLTSEQLDTFYLSKYISRAQNPRPNHMTPDKLLLKLLPVVEASRSAELCDCGVTAEGCSALRSALRSNSSQLRKLDLTGNKVGVKGLKLISDALKDPHCKLETLRLWECGVTDEGCSALSSALRSNSSQLRELDLTGNKVGDTGVKLISDALKDPHCKLEKLGLWECGVTDEGCSALSSALRSNSSQLRELSLSHNRVGDTGVKLISDALKDPHCKLEELRLWSCGVTDEGCSALSSALRSNSSPLRELNLSWNKVGDTGVKLISDALKDPHCKLETLGLSKCGVTDEGCAALSSALRSNSSQLRELDLSWNDLEQSSLNLLSALKDDPCYKLEKLMY
ncbi:NACHT, LRR and PYD domains-containing protein 12 isoform X35 [Carassius gibelio]|uniref:NACHT, LRR and PYD domains-containing protein 12 isoform X35 n=1 Tax=Carassius gibelio TaxID=101364 RepID=UPI00227748BE|nr:NACHT, LRR and PYD domains-containing protein 12 isoform X35 [Carassius gibelio]